MNIFLREMKANRKSLIIWFFGILFMVYAGMGKYGGSQGAGVSMSEMLSKMPRAMLVMLGANGLDVSTTLGYYGMLFSYLAIMAAIHAGMLGANILSKEQRDKTSEFLFVKPVSRNSIITSKLLAALVNILIFNIITFISSLGAIKTFGNGEKLTGDVLMLMLGMFVLQLIFFFLGTGISAKCKAPKISSILTSGILVGTWLLSIGIDLTENLDFLKYITPFKYYEAKNIIGGGNFELVYLVLSICIIGIFLYSTYYFYRKKDL